MISHQQLRELVIQPSLSKINLYSAEAEELLIFTCGAESLGGYYLKQVKGPALGIYQMEPFTYTDHWNNYIFRSAKLGTQLTMHFNCAQVPSPERMITDLAFATVMARVHYLRKPGRLPSVSDVDGMWEYYKQHYNTHLGKATKEESIKKYYDFIQKKVKAAQKDKA